MRLAILEPDLAVFTALAVEAALVHEAMMMPAQQHEVVEARLTAVRPVLDVVAINEFVMGAAREAAAAVSCF